MSTDLQRYKVHKLSPLLQIINITTLGGGGIVSTSDVHIQGKNRKKWTENNNNNNHNR